MPSRQPQIYHITHIENLASIIRDGGLMSDMKMKMRGGPMMAVGMSSIKQKRFTLPVRCYPGDYVADYVPFYFCPRSIMLYLLHRGNHPGLTYSGGQTPILHLEADVAEVVMYLDAKDQRWAFSLSNAGARYSEFRSSLDDFGEINWQAVNATDFRSEEVKEGKQAEFLVHGFFPWRLVRRIGVHSRGMLEQANAALGSSAHQPRVTLQPDWYF